MEQNFNVNQILTAIKKFNKIKIEDKFLVIHSRHYDELMKILDDENIEIDSYKVDCIDEDKIYLIDKLSSDRRF